VRLLENKIIFLLITILLLYLMFTKTGIEGLKRIVADLTGSGAYGTPEDVTEEWNKATGTNQPKVAPDIKKEMSGGIDINNLPIMRG
jgi:hypothetical protein